MRIKISEINEYNTSGDIFNQLENLLINKIEPINLIKEVSECVELASKEFGIKNPKIISKNENEVIANYEGLYLSSKKERELAKIIRRNIHIYEISAELEILVF